MTNEPQSTGITRRHWLAGCALVLLCAGAALLAPLALTTVRRFDSGAIVATLPAATGLPVAPPTAYPINGKLAPTPPAARWAAIPPQIDQQPIPARAAADFDRLMSAVAPVHDYFTAAEELGRIEVGERASTATDYRLGRRQTFFTADGPREAVLVYLDELAAYWVETGLTLDPADLAASAERLRTTYYPLLSRHFGQEWRPGVDGDPRFTVLHVLGAADTHELGYFTDENEYPAALFPQSNAREMVYLNMTRLEVGTPLYDGTLVHEIQHLIQWNLDANEEKWLNEGLSQVAETVAGLDTVDPHLYLEQTNIRLDVWTAVAPEVYAQYGASYLYLLYLWEQLGDDALAELARHPANGLAAVRAVLAGHQPDRALEEFTADWATALYLDGETADPRFALPGLDLPPPFFANRVRQLPFAATATVEQFGLDVIDLDLSGRARITFAGDTTAPLFDTPPGEPVWYAPPANSSRQQLTAAADLTSLMNATLSFAAWYDLEPGFDYAYLSVSDDGGATWQLLSPNHATVGAYGPAWGGGSAAEPDQAGGWVNETINLHAYAGRPIMLRFDVTTDFEQSGRGFALGGLAIPELAQQPVWQPDGFVETGALLPQRWAVRLIVNGNTPQVIPLSLDELNRGQIDVELGPDGGALLVLALTPGTRTTADYWLAVEQ